MPPHAPHLSYGVRVEDEMSVILPQYKFHKIVDLEGDGQEIFPEVLVLSIF